jgi:signal transduction histidine kinase/CheY-like chemotaxis protein
MRSPRAVLLLIAAALMASIITVVSFQVTLRQRARELAAVGQDNIFWSFYQINSEYLRLRASLAEFEVGRIEPDALMRRYDIFVSRLNVVNGGTYRALFDGRDFYDNVIASTEGFVRRSDAAIAAAGGLTPAVVAGMADELGALQDVYLGVVLGANNWSATNASVRWTETERLQDQAMLASVVQVVLSLLFAAIAGLQIAAISRSHRRLQQMTEDLSKARNEAEGANRAKSAFLANISHEIRTPMNGVIGLLGLMLESPLPARERDYAASALRSAENLLALVNDILDFSKLEAERLTIEAEDFDLGQLVDDVVNLLAPRASEIGNVIERQIDANAVLHLHGDALRVRQILFNLVGNAVKFTRNGTIILRIGTTPAPDDGIVVRCSVSDTGIGIAADQVGRLFQRFTQVDESPTRRFGGTGLGLAICRELCELMGGEISVSSELGVGSTFSFSLRCQPAKAALTAPSPEAVVPSQSIAAPMRLLVVDDVPANRTLLGAMLERDGHTVYYAADGREAVQAVMRAAFDLVLMDIQMPVLDGAGATLAIRALDGPAASVPIIAVTANTLAEDHITYRKSGMQGSLDKPIRRDALRTLLLHYAPVRANMAPVASGAVSVDEAGPVADALIDPEQISVLMDALGADEWQHTLRELEATVLTEMDKIAVALDAGEPYRRHAHLIKGLALNVGARAIADLAAWIEKAEPADARARLAEFAHLLPPTLAAMRLPVS